MELEWQPAIIKPWDGRMHVCKPELLGPRSNEEIALRKAGTGIRILVAPHDESCTDCLTCGNKGLKMQMQNIYALREKHGAPLHGPIAWICSSEVSTD